MGWVPKTNLGGTPIVGDLYCHGGIATPMQSHRGRLWLAQRLCKHATRSSVSQCRTDSSEMMAMQPRHLSSTPFVACAGPPCCITSAAVSRMFGKTQFVHIVQNDLSKYSQHPSKK